MLYKTELEIALNAVKKACTLCADAQKTLVNSESVNKKDRSPVTIADFGSQAIINLALLEAFDEQIVGEEDSSILKENNELCQKVINLVKKQISEVSKSQVLDAIDAGAKKTNFSKRFWTVDPIDGTKGFLRKEQYAIALALVENGKVVLGILGCPNFPVKNNEQTGCIFYAVKNTGAFTYILENDKLEKISVVQDMGIENARFCESVEKAHAAHDIHAAICKKAGIKAQPFRMDSQAKYAAVASGKASVYIRLPRSKDYREKIWDHAAGAIIVEQAGGRVTDFGGNPLDFSAGKTLINNVGILATNSHLHEKILAAI